jgi:hypothetical protein
MLQMVCLQTVYIYLVFGSNSEYKESMKKLVLSFVFFAGTAIAVAQVENQSDRQEADQNKIQQEPQRPAERIQERAARIDAQRNYNLKIEQKKAKKLARKEERAQARELK